MIGVDRSRENLSGIGLALKKEIIIKDLLIPPQEEVIQLILRHDFLVGKDFTIECAVWKRKSVCPHTGVATWSECVIVRECITSLYIIDEPSSQTYEGLLTMVAT